MAGCLDIQGEPGGDCRRLRFQGLLLWQARDSWEDHWAAEQPGATEPYYRTAGMLFVNDLRGPSTRGSDPRTARWRRPAVCSPTPATWPSSAWRAGPSTSWNNPLNSTIHFSLPPNATAPPGFPVLWLDPGAGLDVSPAAKQRLTQEVGAKNNAAVTCRLRSPVLQAAEANPPSMPRMDPSQINVHGLYRGQTVEFTTRVELYPLPDTIVFHQSLPTTGYVAVLLVRKC